MVDRDIIFAKAAAVEKHVSRIKKSVCHDFKSFEKNLDSQDIVLFNLQLAIQNCIDIAAHFISDENLGIAGSTNELFYILERNGYLDHEMTEKMVKAVGFRNLIVHEYVRLELKRVYEITQNDILDLEHFLKHILLKI